MAGVNVTTGPVWTFATAVNPNAALSVTGAAGSGDDFVLTFPSEIGPTYRVQRTDGLNPTDWVTLADRVPGTGSPIVIPDSGVSAQTERFYRVLILSP